MKASLAACLLGLLARGVLGGAPPGYRLVWSDNFSAPLNVTEWGTGQKPWGTTDNPPALITPEDTYLENGTLVLRSRMGSFGAYNYTTGWSYTKTWRQYGYIEIRAQYPVGAGVWPAFWMLSTGWPPEVDAAEFRGPPLGYMTNAYYDGSWSTKVLPGSYGDWNTWGLLWEPGALTYYHNGAETYSTSKSPNQTMYIILSNGLDGTSCGPQTGFPNYFTVDYVHWYQNFSSAAV
ncbi:Endo-1 [Diplonema papillatum]|nr:Endo-1 [Diplonema papillatum]